MFSANSKFYLTLVPSLRISPKLSERLNLKLTASCDVTMKVFGNQILQKKKDLVDVNLKGTENKLTFIRCFVILVDL